MINIEDKSKLSEKKYDEIILGVYESNFTNSMIQSFDKSLAGGLADILESEVTGEVGETTVIHTFGKTNAKKLIILGLGKEEKFTYSKMKEAMIHATKVINSKGQDKQVGIYIDLPSHFATSKLLRTLTEAFHLASYQYEDQNNPKTTKAVNELTIFVAENALAEATKGQKVGEAVAKGITLTRNLTDLPSNYLTPSVLKDEIVGLAKRYKMKYDVLDEDKLTELAMGGILGVSKGSVESSYVVTVKYEGAKNSDQTIALVGKGVTFDSGGLSLKNKSGLEILKKDMNGAATVMGVIEAIGQLQPAINILLVIGCVENMPSGSAYKPGDVVTMMDGTTVEIISTDAEGRIVLGDCITYAKEQGVSSIIDCASLTGAVRIALGYAAAGVMGNDQQMVDEFIGCSKQAVEKAWQLPLYEEYKDNLKSQVADLKNSGGGGFGGAMIAGKFIEHFVQDTPWIHLDISSSGYARSNSKLMPIGATGAMVGTITQYLLGRE